MHDLGVVRGFSYYIGSPGGPSFVKRWIDMTGISPARTPDADHQTAAAYVEAISTHAKRLQEEHLLCGTNFRDLARFLSLPAAGTNNGQLRVAGGKQTWPHAFATCIYLEPDQSPTAKEFAGSTGPQDFLRGPQLKSGSAQLLFLRGFPSPEWLRVLGAQLRIDPEFFRQHLGFLQRKDFYDIPALPSFSRNLLQLRVTTIFTRQAAITQQAVQLGRRRSVEDVRKHQVQLEQNAAVGDSIVRQFSIHNENTFTIEQNISCCVVKKNGGWAGTL